MNLLIALAVGVVLGIAEIALRRQVGASPDLAALALALLLAGSSSKQLGARCLGLLLGASTCSIEPVGVFLLGGGLAATLLVPARAFVFLESSTTRALFALTASLALAIGRELHAWLKLTAKLPWSQACATTPLLTVAAAPILALAGVGFLRMARWSVRRLVVLRGTTGGPPPS